MPQRNQLRRRQTSKSSQTRQKQSSPTSSSPSSLPQSNRLLQILAPLQPHLQPVLLVLRAVVFGILSAASLTRDSVAVFVFIVSLASMLGALLRVYISILGQQDQTPVQLPAIHRPNGTVTSPEPITVKDHDQKIANNFAAEFPGLGMAAAWFYMWSYFRPSLLAYSAYIMYRITYHPLFRIHLFKQEHQPEFERPWGGAPLFRNSPDESVKVVAGVTEFEQALEDAGEEKLVVVDFSATWCGPCKAMAPVFKQLADDFSDCIFISVDVDVSQDVAAKMAISSVPTFILFKNGERVEMLRGASEQSLRETIQRQM